MQSFHKEVKSRGLGLNQPRAKDLEEIYRDVVDPATQEYYLRQKGEKPKKKINAITRFRTLDGEEYLYSLGSVKFSDMNRNTVVKPCDKQETYLKPNFKHRDNAR